MPSSSCRTEPKPPSSRTPNGWRCCSIARRPIATLAWISTARDEANISGLSGLLDDAEGTAVPPGDGDGLIDKAGGEDDRKMGAAGEAHADLALGGGDVG